MFLEGDARFRLMMCEDCRVVVQFERRDDPFAGKPRPLPRTGDDDIRERDVLEAKARLAKERGGGNAD
jgi:hypothetical protein